MYVSYLNFDDSSLSFALTINLGWNFACPSSMVALWRVRTNLGGLSLASPTVTRSETTDLKTGNIV